MAGDFVTRGNAVLSLITRKLAFLGRPPSDQAPASVFATVHGSPSKTESVYAFESAIDALSLATYFLKTKTRDLLSMVGFMSTAGVSAKPIAVDADVKFYCAYDADPAGDAAAKTWPRRARPPAKDNNTFLVLWAQSERHKKKKTASDVAPSSLPEALHRRAKRRQCKQ